MEKTNVTRLLDVANIDYNLHCYDPKITDGESIAKILEEDSEQVFKTLVTVANTKEHFVFCIPVKYNLDLKKAASVVGVKSIEMIPQKELLPLTGYIHGGCSPIGMKKQYTTVFHSSMETLETVTVSAGRIGAQVELAPKALLQLTNGKIADVATEE